MPSGDAINNVRCKHPRPWKDKTSGESARKGVEWHRVVFSASSRNRRPVSQEGQPGLCRGSNQTMKLAGQGRAGPIHDRDPRRR